MNFKRKVWIGILVSVIGIFLICFFLIPTFLSSNSGKRLIIGMIEKNTGGTLKIQSLSLKWFRGQQIDHFQFNDNQGGQITFDQFTTGLSLWNLLMKKPNIGATSIESLTVIFSPKPPHKTSPQKIVDTKKEKKETFWSNIQGHLVISKGMLIVKKGVIIDNLFIDIDIPKIKKIKSIELRGTTKQHELSGSFNAQLNIENRPEGKANFNNLPVEGLDHILSFFHSSYQGLLIESLGDSFNAQIKSSKTGDFLVSFRSPRLFINLNSKYTGKELILNQAGRVAWTVKSNIMNYFNSDILLQNDIQSELLIESATLPIKNKIDFPSLAAKGSFSLTGGNFFLKKIRDTIGVEDLTFDFSTKNLKKLLSVNLKSQFKYKNKKNDAFSLHGAVSIQNALEKKRLFPTIDLHIDNLPLTWIDSWNQGSFAKYLGDTFSGKIHKSEETFNLSGKTPFLYFNNALLRVSDRARLTRPVHFLYLVRPLYENLSHSFTCNGTLNALSIPLKGHSFLLSGFDFDLDLKTETIDFTDFFSLGQASCDSIEMAVKGNFSKTVDFNGNGQLNFSEDALGKSILGNTVFLFTDGTLKSLEKLKISPLNITLEGKKFKGTIEGAVEENLFILKNPFKGNFLLEPQQINPILLKGETHPLLSEPTFFYTEIKSGQIPLKNHDLEYFSLKGIGAIKTLSLINPANHYPFKFQDVELDFNINEKKDSHILHLEANALEKNAPEGKLNVTLTGKGEAPNLILSPEKVKASLLYFPSQIADSFLNFRGHLSDMIGNTFNLQYETAKAGTDQKNIDIRFNSPYFNLDCSLVAGKMLELRSPKKPLKIRLSINEKGYMSFIELKHADRFLSSNHSTFKIEESDLLNIQFSHFSFPIKDYKLGFPKPDFNLYSGRFDANARIDHLKLKEKTSGVIAELKDFDCDISKPNNGNTPLSFKFDGDILPYKTRNPGKIQGTGKLEDYLSHTNSFDLNQISTSIHAQIKNLPTVFIDALSNMNTSFTFPPSAFLGDLFNANFDAEVKKSEGKISLDIDASGFKAPFFGIVSNGILYLQKPLKIIFTLTPKLNDILEKTADLAVTAKKEPITLYIHNEGFAVPLNNLHIRNMSFNDGRIDFGQIIVKDSGNAGEISNLFKISSEENIPLWVTPCKFNMQAGKMYINRTEILYNHTYQVCLWGKIKFPSRKIDITLGFTAQALRAALGIQGLDNGYVLKIPVRGSFGNIKINTGLVAAKIAFLLAHKHFVPQTGVFGQVLGTVRDLTDDQSDVPSPNPPFPWQKS